MTTALTNLTTDAAIALLAPRMPGVAVSGPRDLTPIAVGEPICIVQAPPGPPLYDEPSRVVTYTVRCYGATGDDAQAAFDALDAATRTAHGPLCGVAVDGRWWLLSAGLGTPGTPIWDPEARRWLVVSTLALHWGADEL